VSLAVLLAVILASALAAGLVVAMAYRNGTPKAWNGVAVFAVGLIVMGYGALEELLSHLGTTGASSRAWVAIACGLLVAVGGVAYVRRERPR
jgi:hypothetical protein